jgi:ABC-type glutathione transport system ATPase component
MTVGGILAEPLTARNVSRKAARDRVAELLDQVRLARALALDPRLIICDEPVSALDLSTQARVLDLFVEIQQRTGVGRAGRGRRLTEPRAEVA